MKQRGFTLLEVMVAFTLLAMLFGVLFEVFAGGLAAVRRGETYVVATMLAQSKLAELTTGPEYAAGTRSGVFDRDSAGDGRVSYRWTLTLTRYGRDELGLVDRGLVRPYVATIDVHWEEFNRPRNVSLTTLVLGTR